MPRLRMAFHSQCWCSHSLQQRPVPWGMPSPHLSLQQQCPCSHHSASLLTLKDFCVSVPLSYTMQKTYTMQSLRETLWSAASTHEVESTGTSPFSHSQSAVCGHDWNGRFLSHSCFSRRITEYGTSWCSAATRIPLLVVSLPGTRTLQERQELPPARSRSCQSAPTNPLQGPAESCSHPGECLRKVCFRKDKKCL